MFTGLIDRIAEIRHIQANDHGTVVTLQLAYPDLQIGESIAFDGICLTLAAVTADSVQVACSPETLALTRAQYWQVGARVNCERALKLGDRLGGHFVLGHVDCMARVLQIEELAEFQAWTFGEFPAAAIPFIMPKGSLAINGVSLTINAVSASTFTVMLVPHTLAATHFAHLPVGAAVNLEYDYFARIIQHQLKEMA